MIEKQKKDYGFAKIRDNLSSCLIIFFDLKSYSAGMISDMGISVAGSFKRLLVR